MQAERIPEPHTPRRPAERRERRPPPSARLGPGAVLALQRSAGNARVARMLARAEDEAAEPVAGPATGDLEVRFPLDADGDGELETKRLYITGEGADAQLVINPEPMVFEEFIQQNPHFNTPVVSSTVRKIRTLMKKPITKYSGADIERLLEALAKEMQKSFNVQVPPTRLKKQSVRTITDGNVAEQVTDHLIVEPLSARPGDGLVGTGVQQAATPFMNALHKWAQGYVRGHMLNAKLHGPGVDFNLVPISGAFNSAMKNGVEDHLKKEVSSRNLVVSYEIQPTGWNTYKGTNQGSPIEKALPAGFTMHARPMKLKQPLIDGTKPGNWELANAGDRDFTQVHNPPGTKRFDENAEPHKLGPGVYIPDDTQLLWENSTHKGVWVFQGRLDVQAYTGQSGGTRDFDDPVNLVGLDSAKNVTPLKQVGDALVVTDKPAAQAAFQSAQAVHDYRLGQLKNRLKDTDDALTKATAGEGDAGRDLAAWAERSGRRLEELRQRNLATGDYEAQAERRAPLVMEHDQREHRIAAAAKDHLARMQAFDEVSAGFAQFRLKWLQLLASDETRFWKTQTERESELTALEEDKDAITYPNREAEAQLKDLIKKQGFLPRNLGSIEDDEERIHREQMTRWQREEREREQLAQARERKPAPMDLSGIDLSDILVEDLDLAKLHGEFQIDIPELTEARVGDITAMTMDPVQPPSALPQPPHLHAPPHRGTPPRLAPVDRPEVAKLLKFVETKLKRGDRKFSQGDQRSLQDYKRWRKAYFKAVAEDVRSVRRPDPQFLRSVARKVERARADKLEQLGVVEEEAEDD